ncbi:MAG: hypothetical protein II794_06925 [Oscillospiraceae bacterium]|nr:hypothetical protein [Oscillospiraceae bacterium]
MKKAIAILLLLSLLLSLCSCAVTPEDRGEEMQRPDFTTDEYIPGYDVPKSVNAQINLRLPYLDTKDTFYFIGDPFEYVRYYDKTTGILDYLCFKPECQHNDDQCGAYCMGAKWTNNFELEGKLYIPGRYPDPIIPVSYHSCVYTMAIDGSERSIWYDSQSPKAKEMVIPESSNSSRSYLHRGYLYTVGSVRHLEDGVSPQYYARVYARKYDGPYNDSELIFEYKFENSSGSDFVRFAGHYIYYLTSENVGTQDIQLRLFKIDTVTWESQFVAQVKTTRTPRDMWVESDGTVYISMLTGEGFKIGLFKEENGEFVKIYESSSDIRIAEGMIVSLVKLDKENHTIGIVVRNLQGEVICEGPVSLEALVESIGEGIYESRAAFNISHVFYEEGRLYLVLNFRASGNTYSLISCSLGPDGPENETLIWIQGK